jgi:AcrR family transcriptional regulator
VLSASMSVPAALRRNVIGDPAGVPPRLRLHPAGSPGRHGVEAFISAVYRERYGAELRHFAPLLVSLHDADGDCVAAAGWRAADSGPLFLERYLSGAVESLLPAPAGRRAARQRIVEVGHLAAARAGEGRRLILLLGPHLAGQGFEWVVSTLTQELRNLFVRMGVAPLALGVADPTVLGEQAAQWGSYYDHRPLVLAGRLDAAVSMLARRSAAS